MRATVRICCSTAISLTMAVLLAAGHAAACTPNNPQLLVSAPSTSFGVAGRLVTYSVSVTNLSTADCGTTTYLLNTSAPASPTGWSIALGTSEFDLTPGQTGTTQLQVRSPNNADPGTYGIGVNVASYPGYVYRASATATYTVNSSILPDFLLGVTTGAVSVQQGGSGTVGVSTTVSGGFNAAVSLSATGLPAGVTTNFSVSGFPQPGSGSATITFNATSGAALGTTTVTVTASGGGITHSVPVSLTITSASPVVTGLTVRPVNPTVPAGTPLSFVATALLSNNSTLDVSNSAATVWNSSNTAVANMTGSTANAFAPGSSTIKATYTDPVTHSVFTSSTTLTVTSASGCTHRVPLLEVSGTPSASGAPGRLVSYGIKITDQDDSTCDASTFLLLQPVSPPAGWSIVYVKNSFSLSPGQVLNTTLQLVSPSTLGPGSYDITVRAVNWANFFLESDALATYVVNSTVTPSFAVGLNPGSVTVQRGGSGTTTASVTLYGGFSDPLTFTTDPLPTGIHVAFNPAGLAGGVAGSTTVTVSADNTAALGPVSVKINANNSTTESATLVVTVTDTTPTLLAINISPTDPTVQVGSTQQFTATGIYSNTSSQDLTLQSAWDTTDHAVATVDTSGKASTFQAKDVTVTATYQGVTGSTTLHVQAPAGCVLKAPTIAVTPDPPASVPPGQLVTYSVALTNNNQGCGTSTFLLNLDPGAPPPPAGFTVVFQYASFALADGETGTSALQVRSPGNQAPATYYINIVGMNWPSYNYRKTAQVQYIVNSTTVPYFTITTLDAAVSVDRGSSTTETVTVTPQNSFADSVDLSVSGEPSGVTWAFQPPSLNISGSAANSVLTLSASSTAQLGTANITITGKAAGGETESTTIPLTVNSTTPTLLGISVTPGDTTVTTTNPPITYSASGIYSNSTVVDRTGPPTIWTSSNPAVATMGGLLGNVATIAGAGTTTITASYGGKTGTSKLTVTNTGTCIRANPTVTLTPSSDGPGIAGRLAVYNITITDNDSAACAASTFLLKGAGISQFDGVNHIQVGDAGAWSVVFLTNSFSLTPGQTGTTSMQVRSPNPENSGTFEIDLQAFAWPAFTYQTTVYPTYIVQ